MRITPEELAALSLILGSYITASDAEVSTASADKGALGISIHIISTANGKHLVSLTQHKRSVSQMPSSGSGHSPLFAKHLACGSLPFSQDGKAINSLLITNDTLAAVQSGLPLTTRKRTQQSPQAKFLATLPSSRALALHTLEPSTKSGPQTPLIDALAQLAFAGGLTPLASLPLIATTQFIASAGLAPGRLLQRLEALVDKVQRHTPLLAIFGPLHEPRNAGLLFRERERLAKVANGALAETALDRAARVHRYAALLHRLMALLPAAKQDGVRIAVQAATARELSTAYVDAVAARAPPSPSPSPPSPSHAHAHAAPPQTLGKQVEALLRCALPFSVDDVARVARLVLVAWTLSVGGVAWEGANEGGRVVGVEGVPRGLVWV